MCNSLFKNHLFVSRASWILLTGNRIKAATHDKMHKQWVTTWTRDELGGSRQHLLCCVAQQLPQSVNTIGQILRIQRCRRHVSVSQIVVWKYAVTDGLRSWNNIKQLKNKHKQDFYKIQRWKVRGPDWGFNPSPFFARLILLIFLFLFSSLIYLSFITIDFFSLLSFVLLSLC